MQRPAPHRPRKQQRGVAILTVMVIAVLTVTLATVIFARQSRTVREADNYQSLERAWQYAIALEQFVGMELQRDAKTNHYDAFTDDWAITIPALPMEEGNKVKVGEFKGKVEDLQARFNLNNVLDEKGKLRTSGEDQQLKKLVTAVGLPESFAQRIMDWVDPDTIIQSGDSAESDYYLSGAIPYRAADMPMADPSELRLLRMESEPKEKTAALAKLLPHVIAVPFKKLTVNANTASPEVLQAIGLTQTQIDTLLTARNTKKPYKSSSELLTALALTDPKEQERLKTALDVTSSYFRLQGEIRLGRARVFLTTTFFRDANRTRVIMRQFDRAEPEPPPPQNNDDASTAPATS